MEIGVKLAQNYIPQEYLVFSHLYMVKSLYFVCWFIFFFFKKKFLLLLGSSINKLCEWDQ